MDPADSTFSDTSSARHPPSPSTLASTSSYIRRTRALLCRARYEAILISGSIKDGSKLPCLIHRSSFKFITFMN